MAVLTTAEYPVIRGALGGWLDADDVPDSLIELPIHLAAAERWVLSKQPTALAMTGDDLQAVKDAGSLYCAGLIAPGMQRLTGETDHFLGWTGPSIDWDAKAAQLFSRAEQVLADRFPLLDPIVKISHVARAPGARGQ